MAEYKTAFTEDRLYNTSIIACSENILMLTAE